MEGGRFLFFSLLLQYFFSSLKVFFFYKNINTLGTNVSTHYLV